MLCPAEIGQDADQGAAMTQCEQTKAPKSRAILGLCDVFAGRLVATIAGPDERVVGGDAAFARRAETTAMLDGAGEQLQAA